MSCHTPLPYYTGDRARHYTYYTYHNLPYLLQVIEYVKILEPHKTLYLENADVDMGTPHSDANPNPNPNPKPEPEPEL